MAATPTQRHAGVGGRPFGNSSRMSSSGKISSSQFQLLNQTISRIGTVGSGDEGEGSRYNAQSARPPHTDPPAPSAPSRGCFVVGATRSARPQSQTPPALRAKSTPRPRDKARFSNHPDSANRPQTKWSKGTL